MKTRYPIALSMLAGAALGAISVGGLYAQGKTPGAYVVIDITEIKDPDLFKTIIPKAAPSMAPYSRDHNVYTVHGIPINIRDCAGNDRSRLHVQEQFTCVLRGYIHTAPRARRHEAGMFNL